MPVVVVILKVTQLTRLFARTKRYTTGQKEATAVSFWCLPVYSNKKISTLFRYIMSESM
jgi:hypothetical protein